ncbi:hybrid pks-nrps [Trichoderma arundinaceum]|uniref:Hybrid pks-nrps n=1 Tax=Trichoderma arundinaceum TaxID=490622 RepID=A0A395NSI8_TRIAR|nr:hybrid pks-nrps [Trichoderma arundinaceum]
MKEPIAIISSACRFPGGSNSPTKLWELLREPRDILEEFNPEVLRLSKFSHQNGEHHGSTDVKGSSYTLSDDCRLFDASFFNISPLEAESMDPQQRILLEIVYEAFESAGYTLQDMQGSLTSVHVGVMNGDYYDLQMRDPETIPTHTATGTARSILSNRVSYTFDLRGPSMTIDTACSSSLVALHQAVQGLRNGDAEMAVVGGANLLLDPIMYIAESNLHMLSPDSRSRMWDKSANGYARGEGFAAVLLKPLSTAIREGDSIECVIRETAVNSDGRTKGITVPSPIAQATLIRQAYMNAGLDPILDRCQYFECHGTGTAAGDPVEAQAIRDAFFPVGGELDFNDNDKLYVGSIKTVIGHLEGCAELAGLLKAMLAIKNRTIPPNLHFRELNPRITPFYDNLHVPTEALPWPERTGMCLRASVNSFGFGGTNAHAILESYEGEVSSAIAPESQYSQFIGPLVFSATSGPSLLATVRTYAELIRSDKSLDLENLAWILQKKRSTLPIKAFFSGATPTRLLSFMDRFVADMALVSPDAVGTRTQTIDATETPGILGVFTGQGAQWLSMGRGLYESSHVFKNTIDHCQVTLSKLPEAPSWSLREQILADKGSSRVSEAAVSQPICTALQIGLVDLLRECGVKIDAVVGHSSGEIAAVYAAGIISREAAMQIAYYRGFYAHLARSTNGQQGSMMAVGISYDDAFEFCRRPQYLGRLTVAASNSPLSVTLSGDSGAISEAKEYFDNAKTFARPLKVDTAYHSHHMQPCAAPYLKSLLACNIEIRPPKPDCIWTSSVRGDADLLEDDGLVALKGQYWIDNLLQMVQFSQAVEHSIWNGGPFNAAIEIGPHPALKGPAEQTLRASYGTVPSYAGLMRRGDDEVEAFSGALGYLWSHLGPAAVNFDGYRRAFDRQAPLQIIKGLPSYSWDHRRSYWRESRLSRNYRLRNDKGHDLLGRRMPDDSEHELRWRNIIRLQELSWIQGHLFQGQVLFPGAGYIAMALQAASYIAGDRSVELYEICDVVMDRAMIIPEGPVGIETLFSVRILDGRTKAATHITNAEFSCYYCSDENSGQLVKCAYGRIICQFDQSNTQYLPSRVLPDPSLVPVDMERFYKSMSQVGQTYQGAFHGIKEGKRALGLASIAASWPEEALNDDSYIIHPAFLDVTLQTLYIAFSSPASSSYWSPYLPVKIDRLSINPHAKYVTQHNRVEMEADSFITTSTSTVMRGDIHVYQKQGSQTMLQVEGLEMRTVSDPQPSDDKYLFSETIWRPDPSFGLSDLDNQNEFVENVSLMEILDRTAVYYYRTFLHDIALHDKKGFTWYHQRMCKAAEAILQSITDGQHPIAQQHWLEDSYDLIMELSKEHESHVHLQIIHAIGKELKELVLGNVQILEIMLADNMLNRFYVEGYNFSMLNDKIGEAMKQIVFKNPQANILEIGAGTGGTTSSIFHAIGQAYLSYTFTDISTGFFSNAEERFRDHSSKMTFQVLDVEKDPASQGFIEHSYDIIIAANVFHATRTLSDTMRHVRGLLKPGGFLLMLEVTGPQMLRTHFIMGALSGWWLGGEDGRLNSPAVTAPRWDNLLRESGFSGVDSICYDTIDETKHSVSFMVSQAIDQQVELLRDPLSEIGNLQREGPILIVGGKTLFTSNVINDILKVLSPLKKHITVAKSLENAVLYDIQPQTSVIFLEDLDKPIFFDITPKRWKLLQELLLSVNKILWVTEGRLSRSPLSNMMIGIGRTLWTELPHLTMQFLDIDMISRSRGICKIIAQSFLRMELLSLPEYQDPNNLWRIEPEIMFDGQRLLLPRILPNEAMNNRYNSASRQIKKIMNLDDAHAEIIQGHGSWSVVEKVETATNARNDGCERVNVEYSFALQLSGGKPLFLSIGPLSKTTRIAAVLSTSSSSVLDIPSGDIAFLNNALPCTPQVLEKIASDFILAVLSQDLPGEGTVIMHEAPKHIIEQIESGTVWKDKHVRFTSTNPLFVAKDWIRLFTKASATANKLAIPSDASCFIGFESSSTIKAQSFLPTGSTIITLAEALENLDLVNNRKILSSVLSNSAFVNMLPVSTPIFTLDKLVSMSLNEIPALYMVDWSSTRSLQITIKPLITRNLFSGQKTYLLVGMTRELGLSLTHWMIQNGARHVALTSRTGSIEDPKWIGKMKELGANVHMFSMDVADMVSVTSTVSKIRETMPPISGVCNAAMVLSDALFVDMDFDTLATTLKPKVDGSRNLDQIFHDTPLDFFVLFSSMASVIGNPGQSNYHAANLFMESLCAQRRSRGLAATAMHIGMVTDVGYVARRGQSMEDHLRKMFFLPLSESDVHQLFAESIAKGSCDIVFGLEQFIDSKDSIRRPPWDGNPRFSHFILQETSANNSSPGQMQDEDYKQRLQGDESEDSLIDMVQTVFATKLESMMQLSPNSVNISVPLIDLGVDSLLAVEIRTWFLKKLGMDVPVLKVLSGDTIAQLCEDATRRFLDVKLKKSQTTDQITQPLPSVMIQSESASEDGTSGTQSSDGLLTDSTDHSIINYDDISSNQGDGNGLAVDSAATRDSNNQSPSLHLESDDVEVHDFGASQQMEHIADMSHAQSRLWVASKYVTDPTTYNVTVVYEIQGNLQITRFKQALSSVMRHHESLKTCFFEDINTGHLLQGVLSSPSYFLRVVKSDDAERLEWEVNLMKGRQWDLEHGRTFGATVISHSPVLSYIIFGYHHIVLDGVSWHLFLKDLDTAYNMKPLLGTSKYVDFAKQQQEAILANKYAPDLQFWEDQHQHAMDPVPLLPITNVVIRKPLSQYVSHVESRMLDQKRVSRIKKASKSLSATSFHFHLAVVQFLFSRFLERDDICIGIADANRLDENFSDTIGFFLNLLPMRFQVDENDTFADLVKQTSRKAMEALAHSRVPFDIILDHLNIARSPAYSPLFQVAVNYRMGALLQTSIGGCQMTLTQVEDAKNPYDISFGITDTASGTCMLELNCQASIYNSDASKLLLDVYIHLVDTFCTNLELQMKNCVLFDQASAERASELGRGPLVTYDWPLTLSARFNQMKETYADEIAIKDGEKEVTYSQLAAYANAISEVITEKGCSPGAHIAVLCEPTIESVASMVAIIQAGCIYVPLDVSLPTARHDAILSDCNPALLITHNATQVACMELISSRRQETHLINISTLKQRDGEMWNNSNANAPAFLLYTSGSTGRPKGVVLSQANFLNHIALKIHELNIGREVVLQQSSLGFDMSIIQVCCAIANGGTLIIAPRKKRGDPIALSELILRESVTFTIATPTEYLMLLRSGEDNLRGCQSWRHACMGGEVVTSQLLRQFRSSQTSLKKLTNCYGPTEITAAATFQDLSQALLDSSLDQSQGLIGKVLPNYFIAVLDSQGRAVPSGVFGEICIGGAGLAIGYLNSPEQTQSKFIYKLKCTANGSESGEENERLYKTGDKGRLLPNGSVEFFGRIDGDSQVKLRGLRIELGEIESVLLEASSGLFTDVVVLVKGNPEILAAYVVLAPGVALDDVKLGSIIAKLPLPQYMLPSVTHILNRLPTNANGKTDRKALSSFKHTSEPEPVPAGERLSLSEGELLILWQKILPITSSPRRLGRDSDFFMHGGNSLLLMKLQGAIRDAMNLSIPINELYQVSTLGKMADHLSSSREEQAVFNDEPIDWDFETAIPENIMSTLQGTRSPNAITQNAHQIVLTGSTGFLGQAILEVLLEEPTVYKVHCIAIPSESDEMSKITSNHHKIICYQGSLLSPALGLSVKETAMLQESATCIIHAGANGHCLNNYSSLRVPNVHSTHFLANLALPRGIPLHFISSNRVILQSGGIELKPQSVSKYLPNTDGAEGFTATKWASERFLERVAEHSGLPVTVHRHCVLTGDKAPNEDAVNGVLRYSALTKVVPLFENFEGFFDFKDVHVVAREIVSAIMRETKDQVAPEHSKSVHFMHYSSGFKVHVSDLRQHLEALYEGEFEQLSMIDWTERVLEAGIDPLITSYLQAMAEKKFVIMFPYMGAI